MLSTDRTRAYLERLGMDGAPSTDREGLDALVRAHQTHIPFETIRMHRAGTTPSMDLDDIYDLVIVQRQGGYCFELNKLFEYLLRALGFDARPVLCRSVRGREARMPLNHRGILVSLPEGDFFVDVGFGGPMPAGALKLEFGTQQVIDGDAFFAEPIDDAWWALERITRAGADLHDDERPSQRQTELEFCTATAEEQDFDMLNQVFSAPGTLFRDHELANLRTSQGHAAYRDGVLTVRANGKKAVTELADPQAISAVLAEHFGITY